MAVILTDMKKISKPETMIIMLLNRLLQTPPIQLLTMVPSLTFFPKLWSDERQLSPPFLRFERNQKTRAATLLRVQMISLCRLLLIAEVLSIKQRRSETVLIDIQMILKPTRGLTKILHLLWSLKVFGDRLVSHMKNTDTQRPRNPVLRHVLTEI